MLTLAAMCLAQNIFFEARGENAVGKLAVGIVTLNRVESPRYPDSVCDVVWQRKQFSWTHDGKSDNPENYNTHFDKQAWADSKKIALALLEQGEPTSIIEDSTMYHADYVSPYWADHYKPIAQIGSHIFYKEK